MEKWDDSCVDLIYLDPPFNSKVNYNIIYGQNGAGDAQYRAFTDIWHWDDEAAARFEMFAGAVSRPAHDVIVGLHRLLGECGMLAYLTYMAERLEQMHRLLKSTGSIYYHCDPTASHYLKLLMDGIFGGGNFRNEIVWNYSGWNAKLSQKFNSRHDTVLFYGNGKRSQFNSYSKPWKSESEYLKTRKQKLHVDSVGHKYVLSDRGGGKRVKRYLKDALEYGRPVSDVWEIPKLNNSSKERVGYPTQKPLKLLDRILKASSNEGDVVLDPFCGCGTAIVSAQRLGRNRAGIDISSFAIDLIRDKRLKRIGVMAATKGIPYDLVSARKLSAESPFNFESWAIARIPGFAPNTKQVADGGIDGRATLTTKPDDFDSRRALAQTKGGRFNLSNFRDFCHVIDREKAAIGCFITLDEVSSRAARAEAANCGRIRVSGYPYKRMNPTSA